MSHLRNFCELNEFEININRIHKNSIRPNPSLFFLIRTKPDPNLSLKLVSDQIRIIFFN